QLTTERRSSSSTRLGAREQDEGGESGAAVVRPRVIPAGLGAVADEPAHAPAGGADGSTDVELGVAATTRDARKVARVVAVVRVPLAAERAGVVAGLVRVEDLVDRGALVARQGGEVLRRDLGPVGREASLRDQRGARRGGAGRERRRRVERAE